MSESASNHKTFSGKPFSEVEFMINAEGKYLRCKSWKSENSPRFLVVMNHGFGGHCARFEELAVHFTELNGYVFAHDHVGHGESEGARHIVKDYQLFIDDIIQHVNEIRTAFPDLPLFLYGQSMGATLSVLAAVQKPQLFSGLILAGGMLSIDPQIDSSVKKFFINIAATLLPNLQLSSLGENKSSHDEEEIKICDSDPLKSSSLKSLMVLQLVRMMETVTEEGHKLSLPFIALHGTADETCDCKGSKWLHQCTESNDKTLKLYDGGYHDLLHETPEYRKPFIDDITEWVSARLSSTSAKDN